MANIIETIDVDVDVRTAYDQWTQFESFPSFMEGVERVIQIDDTHLHRVATIAGKREEWDAVTLSRNPTSGSRGPAPRAPETPAW